MKGMKKKILTGLLGLLTGVMLSVGVACGEKMVEYTFATLGGEAISNVTVKEGETYELPTPTRDGYRFMGWFATEDCKGDKIVSVMASANATYYAKWEKLYTITLNTDGGQLSENVASVQLIAGENIYDAVKDLQPTKGDLQFGAWFINGTAKLSESLAMQNQDITLKAKYKAAYTVQFKNAANETIQPDMVEYAYVGTTVDAQYSVTGHTEIGREPLEDLVITENAAQNVVVLKYEANDISVLFYPNYPDGDLGDASSVALKYGEEVTLMTEYETEGYCLIGWATERGGEVKYAVDTVSKNLYGYSGEVTPETFQPEDTVSLFGVWKKGYEDAFSGEDYLFIFDETSSEIYLWRAGTYFKGRRYTETKTFYFNDEGKSLIGQLYDDYTFLYSVPDRTLTTYTMYVSPLKGLNENVSIRFDAYDKITYSEKTDTGMITSVGRYEYVEGSAIQARFSSGPLAGKTLTMLLGYVGKTPAFQIRNDSEIMKLKRFVVFNGYMNQYNEFVYSLSLDGYGRATMRTTAESVSYIYEIQEDIIVLYNTKNRVVAGYAKIMQVYVNESVGYLQGYMLYNPALDGSFELVDGSVLTSDGLCNFTYTKGTKVYQGLYTADQSFLGGILMTATDVAETQQEETVSFLFHFTQTEEGEGATVSVTLKSNDYGEYLLKTEENIFYVPLIVFGEEKDKATVYGMNEKGEFIKKLYGTYVYDEVSGLYIFTVTEKTDADVVTVAELDLSKVSAFTFAVDKTSYIYKVHYWYSYTDAESGETEVFNNTYTSDNADETLTLVAGYAIYTKGAKTEIGTYSYSNGFLVVTINGKEGYFELKEENDEKTFTKLLYLPKNIYKIGVDGKTDNTEYLAYDGKGGVKYVTATGEYVGTITEVELPENLIIIGNPTVYKFTATELTVTYILSSNGKNFYVENSIYRGRYTSDDGVLELDGFGAFAKYTSPENDNYTSTYTIIDGSGTIKKIRITTNTGHYVDLDLENKTFRLYDNQIGTNYVVSNGQSTGTMVEFDGLGSFTTYVEKDGESGVEKTDEKKGTYVVEDNEIVMTFENGDEWRGSSNFAFLDGKLVAIFTVVDETLKQTYINELDWSVLILDGKGGAVKYNTNGVKDTGKYVMISGDLLYFVNSAQTDAYVYRFNSETGTVTPPEHDNQIGYYTSDFESLIFTVYGYAIFNGETQYYYYEEDNGEVYIYRMLEDDEDKDALIAAGAEITAYNFVKTYFGTFSDYYTIWNEEQYFYNDGYDIEFVRTGTATNFEEEYPYPVQENEKANLKALWFAPTGSASFSVTGLVYLSNNTTKECTVIRNSGEDGLEMYFMIGNYRYDIVVTYDFDDGENKLVATYEIVRMRLFVQAYSYTYLLALYDAYASNGTQLENTYGMMSVYCEFTKDGEQGQMYADGEYFENSGLKDMNGQLLSFENLIVTEVSNMMVVDIVGSDGYNYRIYFGLITNDSRFKVLGYIITAFVRMQDFTVQVGTDEYLLTVGRLVMSEVEAFVAGTVFEVNLLKKNGDKYESIANENMDVELLTVSDVCVYLVLREKAQSGGYETYVYYVLRFTETIDGAVTDEKVVPAYATAAIEIYAASRITTNAGSEFVEVIQIGEEQKIVYMFYGIDKYVIAECVQDGNVFTVTTTSGETFAVTIEDGIVKSVVKVFEEA